MAWPLLLLLVGVTEAVHPQSHWGALTAVTCTEDSMSVVVDTSSDLLTHDEQRALEMAMFDMFIGHGKGIECRGRVVVKATNKSQANTIEFDASFNLASSESLCGLVVGRDVNYDGVWINSTITINSNRTKFSHTVACFKPDEIIEKAVLLVEDSTHRMEGGGRGPTAWCQEGGHCSMANNSNLRAFIAFHGMERLPPSVGYYPRVCHAVAGSHRVMMVQDGCPAHTHFRADRYIVQVEQNKTMGWLRVPLASAASLRFTAVPSILGGNDSLHSSFALSCKFILCTADVAASVVGWPVCPPAGNCQKTATALETRRLVLSAPTFLASSPTLSFDNSSYVPLYERRLTPHFLVPFDHLPEIQRQKFTEGMVKSQFMKIMQKQYHEELKALQAEQKMKKAFPRIEVVEDEEAWYTPGIVAIAFIVSATAVIVTLTIRYHNRAIARQRHRFPRSHKVGESDDFLALSMETESIGEEMEEITEA